ncbi:MAG: FAD-dependent oxidoreductase [Opitutales bacterium]|nr:FAD-dependent oxidoreductase [Opitutales bacterium]
MAEVETIVIAGSGCAGLSAAIYAARAQLHPLVLEGPQVGGALTQSAQVDNFPGFPEGIRGSDLMKRMRQQAERFDTRFSSTSVQQALLGEKNQKMLTLSNGQTIATQTLIIATGSQANTLHLPREKELLCGKGLSVCATCDGFFLQT